VAGLKKKTMKKADGAVYTLGKEVIHRELNGQIFFLLPGDRLLHTMNPAGEFVWNGILRKQPLPRIVTAFAKHFDIDRETAQRDVSTFLKGLSARKIIVKLARK
jgi:hypothetical protein